MSDSGREDGVREAAALVGTTWESGGGPPAGNRWYVLEAEGERVRVAQAGTGFRYWWHWTSVARVGAER